MPRLIRQPTSVQRILLSWSTVFLLIADSGVRAQALRLDELVRAADVVFTGQVTGIRSSWTATSQGRTIVTVVTFRVKAPLKGDLRDVVNLEFLGGRVGNDIVQVAGAPSFVLGEVDVVCAYTNELHVSPLVGFDQGRFRVVDSGGEQYVTTFSGLPVAVVPSRGALPLFGAPPVTSTLIEFEQEIRRLVLEQQ